MAQFFVSYDKYLNLENPNRYYKDLKIKKKTLMII